MKKSTLFIFLSFLSLFVQAESQNAMRAYTALSFENDVFFKDDGLYSNGLFLTWGYNNVEALNDDYLPGWIVAALQKTHIDTSDKKQHAISYSVGQALQTSIDISVEDLVEEDAPYVGLLAWEVSLLTYDDLVSDEVGVILGGVGPMAGGEFVQTFVHGLTGANQPQGWDNQINNEFVFRVQTRRTWRLFEKDFGSDLYNSQIDFLAGVDGGLGNLRSDISTGVGLRFGQQLSENFSSATVFPFQKFNALNYSPYGWYFFMNVSASYVLNDIFINGNTFSDSHSVDLIHRQVAFAAGIVANIYDVSILYTLLRISDEYEGQAEPSRFGSIAFAYHF